MTKIEEWRTSVSCPRYEVSNFGRARHIRLRHVLKPGRNSSGNLYVGMRRSTGVFSFMAVYRLVAEAFLGECPRGMEVYHLDGNKENNCATNLKYGTHKENIRHAWMLGLCHARRGEQAGNVKLSETKVREIWRLAKTGYSNKCIAKIFNVTSSDIVFILHGRNWLGIFKEFGGIPLFRRCVGVHAYFAKLTDADVLQIRQLRAQGMSVADIAHQFSITKGNVSQIALRHTWKQLL